MAAFDIAVFPADGIGPEVMDAAEAVLDALQRRFGSSLAMKRWAGGAAHYRETGHELEDGAFEAARNAAAILFGAMGLPDVRLPDGTEVAPHLEMRREFHLFAGVRPARKYPNTPATLVRLEAEAVDLIVLRESTEGLFASRGRGTLVDGVARDTLEISRPTSEKLFDFAFRLARRRLDKGRGKGRVTCVDKSKVFVSMAYFCSILDERALNFPMLTADHTYVDAAVLDLVRKPWTFDVMGMAPCAEIGLKHALFHPAHGTAPDIAGRDMANPTAMLVSTVMMLDWLGERAGNDNLVAAADALDAAVWQLYAESSVLPFELGGSSGTRDVTRAVLGAVGPNG